jgi:uncharacterized CHY-type Zn-finger protein
LCFCRDSFGNRQIYRKLSQRDFRILEIICEKIKKLLARKNFSAIVRALYEICPSFPTVHNPHPPYSFHVFGPASFCAGSD